MKMLLILTAALLPLGMIAVFASVQSAHGKRLQREEDAQVAATAEARQIDLLVLRGTAAIRTALTMGATDPARCRNLLSASTRAFHADVRFALFAAGGRQLCASPGFRARGLPAPRNRIGIDVLLLDQQGGLRFTAAMPDGSYGVGELPGDLLREAMPAAGGGQAIVLSQGATHLALFTQRPSYALGEHVTVTAPISAGQVNLTLTALTTPVSAVEILLVLLPVLMWAAAAGIGWMVVNQLLLRPLAQLQGAVADFGRNGTFDLPRLTTPSREIRELGQAFSRTAGQLAEREAKLQEGLSHQMRLTREVHHRVKNNLQVVASLINLHSRGTNGDVADAYASIQRRVDALAVVHRNHYAELEDNRGIALRSLASELAANLRATAPASASRFAITLNMAPAFITQDVAVPVAFLITELVELVMTCDPSGGTAISLDPGPTPDRANLAIEAPGLSTTKCVEHPMREQFDRVITGLSRQLRAPLHYDAVAGRYVISIAILPQPVTDEKSG